MDNKYLTPPSQIMVIKANLITVCPFVIFYTPIRIISESTKYRFIPVFMEQEAR